MKSIPIVTVNDLATDSFIANKQGIDIKLSKATSNGLKLTPDGLIYAASGGTSANPRVLLGAFAPGAFNNFNFNNEVDINISVMSLGSDGNYLYFGLNSQHTLALSHYAHQDATTSGQEVGGVEYANSFDAREWGEQSKQHNVTYSVNGVTRTLMLSHVKLGGVFYVWCDVICVEPLNFIWGGDNPTLPVPIEINGVSYSRVFMDSSFDMRKILVRAERETEPDFWVSHAYILEVAQPSLAIDFNAAYGPFNIPSNDYHAESDTLVFTDNTGNTLNIWHNGVREEFQLSFSPSSSAASFFYDELEQVNIAVYYPNELIMQVYTNTGNGFNLGQTYENVTIDNDLPEALRNWLSSIYFIDSTNLVTRHVLVQPNNVYQQVLLLRNISDNTVVQINTNNENDGSLAYIPRTKHFVSLNIVDNALVATTIKVEAGVGFIESDPVQVDCPIDPAYVWLSYTGQLVNEEGHVRYDFAYVVDGQDDTTILLWLIVRAFDDGTITYETKAMVSETVDLYKAINEEDINVNGTGEFVVLDDNNIMLSTLNANYELDYIMLKSPTNEVA